LGQVEKIGKSRKKTMCWEPEDNAEEDKVWKAGRNWGLYNGTGGAGIDVCEEFFKEQTAW
jgi:hypothetical protein